MDDKYNSLLSGIFGENLFDKNVSEHQVTTFVKLVEFQQTLGKNTPIYVNFNEISCIGQKQELITYVNTKNGREIQIEGKVDDVLNSIISQIKRSKEKIESNFP